MAQKKNFWGKVANVAKTAVQAAGEIKRWLVDPGALTLAPNLIQDLTGPDYVLNSWVIRPIQEGLAQGVDQDERLGNKIGLKGVKIRGKIKNNYNGNNIERIMLIRTRKNFLLESSPNSPLPDDATSFPRYRDVQILLDKTYNLKPVGSSDGDTVFFNHYVPVNGDTFFQDNTANKPDKGVIYFCAVSTDINAILNYKIELTYHDKM